MRTLFTTVRFCVFTLLFAQLFSNDIVAQSPQLVAGYALRTPQNASVGSCGSTPNWALQLDGQPDSTRYFTLSSGYLETYSDGRMRVWATFTNYNPSFPDLTVDQWFNAPTSWAEWQANHSPLDYLSFCGLDDHREQWSYSASDSAQSALQQQFFWYLPPLVLFPMQNNATFWLQHGVGANGAEGSSGLSFEFGYTGSWQNVNGLDYALLQGVGRIALEINIESEYNIEFDIQSVENTFVLDCNNMSLHINDLQQVSSELSQFWFARVNNQAFVPYSFSALDGDSSLMVTSPGPYRRVISTPTGHYQSFDFIIESDSLHAVKRTVLEQMIQAGTSYLFAGELLSSPGHYYDTLQTSHGCDSIVKLILRVENNSLCEIVPSSESICLGDEVSLDFMSALELPSGSNLSFVPDSLLWSYFSFDQTTWSVLGSFNNQLYIFNNTVDYLTDSPSDSPGVSFTPYTSSSSISTYTNAPLYNYDGFTIAFWYFANDTSNRVLWQSNDWEMRLVDGHLAWGYNTGNGQTELISAQSIISEEWNHLAITYNRQGHYHALYLNGQLVQVMIGQAPIFQTERFFWHRTDSLSFILDELTIYSRELSFPEVRVLYSGRNYLWNTSSTSNQIIESPEITTQYSCAFSDELYSCTASTTIEVILSDLDQDGVCDARDVCAASPEVGDFCNDGDPCTLMDIVQPDCSCIGISDPNQAFTLTPSAEKVCGGDSAYFTFTGQPFAVIDYDVNGSLNSISLDSSGLAVLGIAPPLSYTPYTPDTVVIELLGYRIPGSDLCDTTLDVSDTLFHFGGYAPQFVYKYTYGFDNCQELWPWPYMNLGIHMPYLSTLYYSSNFPINFPNQDNPYTNTDSVYDFDLSIDDLTLNNVPQNSDFILTLDSIDFGGCVSQLSGIADTTRIPSQRFTLSEYFWGFPIENGVRRVGCDYYYNFYNYDYILRLQEYFYYNAAFPAESEYSGAYEPSSFEGFDFEFEINDTIVHFNNFQPNSYYFSNELSSLVIVDGTTYIFSLGSLFTDDGPSLYIRAGGNYDLINDTVVVRFVAATGPDGCRQTSAGYYLNNGNAVTYLINPLESLPSESFTISCADEAYNLVGIDLPEDYWGGGGNTWSNQSDFYTTGYLFSSFYWGANENTDTLRINQPGNYYLFSRDISTCQYYQKEFIVTATEGTPCDDGNACTINDAYDEQCLCAGTYVDTDGDGACDALEVSGCTDMAACNYSASATESNGSCLFPGCSDATACNYDMTAGCDDGSCTYSGCTDQSACNYNPAAGCEDGTCVFGGCTDAQACNYEPTAVCDDGSCIQGGCSDVEACNYNPNAPCDNGSCEYLLTYPINGNQLPVEYGQSQYSYMPNAGSSYTWSTAGGIIIQPNGLSQVAVGWASPGIGQVCVQETNESGCMGVEICLDVVIQPAISGCTNNEACNYNPLANVDNNSCLFEGEPCNDGIVTTTNDSIAPWCECSGVLSVVELTPEKQFSCFPNPASNSLSIVYYSDEAMQVTLDILDVQGRVCQGGLQRVNVGTNSFIVDIQHLASGCYSIRINSPKVSRSVVFVKE